MNWRLILVNRCSGYAKSTFLKSVNTLPSERYQIRFFSTKQGVTPFFYWQRTENSMRWWWRLNKKPFSVTRGPLALIWHNNVNKCQKRQYRDIFCTLWYHRHILVNKNVKNFFQLLGQKKKCMERISLGFLYDPVNGRFEFSVKF